MKSYRLVALAAILSTGVALANTPPSPSATVPDQTASLTKERDALRLELGSQTERSQQTLAQIKSQRDQVTSQLQDMQIALQGVQQELTVARAKITDLETKYKMEQSKVEVLMKDKPDHSAVTASTTQPEKKP